MAAVERFKRERNMAKLKAKTKRKATKPAARRRIASKPARSAKPARAAAPKAKPPRAIPSTIVPAMRYRDAPGAIEFLCKAFGFEKHLVVPGADQGIIDHAQLT